MSEARALAAAECEVEWDDEPCYEPNDETLEAMAEIEYSIKNPSQAKRYTDIKTMMAELLADARD
jgi:hypothetical protein